MSEIISYTCDEGDRGQRLDIVCARAFDVSRTQVSRWIKGGQITVESQVITPKTPAQEGWVIVARPPDIVPDELEPEDIPLNIIHEDEDILVINKPAGMVVHQGAGNHRGTLTAALLHHCQGKLSGIGGVERPGIVHRLDKDTSGIMVVAKNDKSHQSISSQFQERTTVKFYLTYLYGKLRATRGSWQGNIGRDPVHRKKMKVLEQGGRNARTDYVVTKIHDLASLVKLQIFTGRTHQIRVHSSHAGYPVVGDELYSRKKAWLKDSPVTRQMLHARKLRFIHPCSNREMELEAALPEDFKLLADYLEKNS